MDLSNNKKIIPILMCGGSGSRLWPMSRTSMPKQFLKCNPRSNNSFLQDTYLRLNNLKNISNPILICNEEHRFIVAEQMREIKVDPESIILEPFGRNTAPAIALGVIKANLTSKDSICLILPADHSIGNVEKFISIIEESIKIAEEGYIITFGVKPTHAETGYGYIEAEYKINSEILEGIPIKKFTEKPNKKRAEEFIRNKKYLWNSGIFLGKVDTLINEFEEYAPEIFSKSYKSIIESKIDLDFLRISREAFSHCPERSFDIAIMEKTKLGIVFPLDIDWSDVGSWDSLWKISKKDHYGNFKSGNIFAENVKNCFFRSESKLVAAIDVEDLIVIETMDAVLITKKESSQRVKKLVDLMKCSNIREGSSHRKIYRPWGSYLSIAEGSSWQVKTIEVKPKASLSLQKHRFRSEHWVVVSGVALVEVDLEEKLLSKNESIYIPCGSKHRLSNKGNENLILIEVQSGSYLGEDDIIRYEDIYGRK